MKLEIKECPYCKGTEFVTGIQEGYAEIKGEGVLTSTTLKHIICRECGCVVRSYVENPEKLLKRKNRRDY